MSPERDISERHVFSCLAAYGLRGEFRTPLPYWPVSRRLPAAADEISPTEFGAANEFTQRFAHVVEIGVSWLHATLLG